MKDKNDKGRQGSDVAPLITAFAAAIAAFAAIAGIFVTLRLNSKQLETEDQREVQRYQRDSCAAFKSAVVILKDDALAGKSPMILDGEFAAGLSSYEKLAGYMSAAGRDTIISNYETIRLTGATVSVTEAPPIKSEHTSKIMNAFQNIQLTLDREIKINAK